MLGRGCTRPHTARGFCDMHWRQDRYGAPSRRFRTPEERAAILKLHTVGMKFTAIARKVKCSPNTVARIVRGETFGRK
jgi:hypothetical protein